MDLRQHWSQDVKATERIASGSRYRTLPVSDGGDPDGDQADVRFLDSACARKEPRKVSSRPIKGLGVAITNARIKARKKAAFDPRLAPLLDI
jgi:hypothetical protein